MQDHEAVARNSLKMGHPFDNLATKAMSDIEATHASHEPQCPHPTISSPQSHAYQRFPADTLRIRGLMS